MRALKFVLVLSLQLFLQTTALSQRAYFINTKHNGVQVFWTDLVENMKLSKIDMDSVSHQEYVTQEIWTCDTVVRIPLSEITSITFKAPPTEYQPGVIRLDDDLWPYVIDSSGLSIRLSGQTPSNLLPKPGDKICTAVVDDRFPYGFAGEVKNVGKDESYILIECNPVELEDVFVTLYCGSGTVYEDSEPNAASSRSQVKAPPIVNTPSLVIKPTTLHLQLPIDVSRKFNEENTLGFKHDSSVDITYENEMNFRSYIIVESRVINRNAAVYATISGYGKNKISSDVNIHGSIDHTYEKNLIPESKTRIPLGTPFIGLNFEFGPFWHFNVDASVGWTWIQERNTAFRIVYSENGAENEALPEQHPISVLTNNHFEFNSLNLSGEISGGLYVGAKISIGIPTTGPIANFPRDPLTISDASLKLRAGVKISGDASINLNDFEDADRSPDFYNKIKDQSLRVSAFVTPEYEVNLLKIGNWNFGWSGEFPPFIDNTLFHLRHFPVIKNFKATRDDSSPETVSVSYDTEGMEIYPVMLSAVAIEKPSKLTTKYSGFESKNIFIDKPFEDYIHHVDALKNYEVAPSFIFNNKNIIASPSCDLDACIEAETMAARNITAVSATLIGRIYVDGRHETSFLKPFFRYSEKGKNEWKEVAVENWKSVDESGSQIFETVEDLKPETEYEYRFGVRNENEGSDIQGETQWFTTEKVAQCDIDFDVVYPTEYRSYNGGGFMDLPSGRYVVFYIGSKPIPIDDEGAYLYEDIYNGWKLARIGTIIFKDSIEVSRGNLTDLDDSYMLGHSMALTLAYPEDLSIDNKNYIARADKAKYQAGMYFEFETPGGSKVILESNKRKDLTFVYDTKPEVCFYSAIHRKKCRDEFVSSDGKIEHHHYQYFYSSIFIAGTFWMEKLGPKDAPSDYAFIPDGNFMYIMMPYFESGYESGGGIRAVYASWIDVNGIVGRSKNTMTLDFDSDGCPIEFFFRLKEENSDWYNYYLDREHIWPWQKKNLNTSSFYRDKMLEIDASEVTKDTHRYMRQAIVDLPTSENDSTD